METQRAPVEALPATASHDADAPEALVEFMSGDWLEAPITLATIPQLDRFKARRDALSRAYPGVYLAIPSGREKVRSNDTHYRFRPSSDFAYLVGAGEPDGLLVLEPRDGGGHDAVLFVPPHNRGEREFFTDRVRGELWVGRHRGVDESQIYFGVDRCRPIQQIESYLDDLRIRGCDVRNSETDAGLATYLGEMRLIKDEYEIDQLRLCVEITKRAFQDVIRILPSSKSEREVEAAFWSRARIEGNDVGYLTIAAAGHHSCTLHWSHNTGKLQHGELLLLDAGVEVDSLYTSDITRTLPISGAFNPEQRAVYELVYAAQRAAFEKSKPGNDFLEPNRAAMRVMTQGLIDLGILRCSLDEALDPQRQYYRRYTLHNVSHMLGIDVHDCAKARSENYRHGTLREGMALTIEPGLYFQPDDATVPAAFRGIGVRIEDDIVITSDGHENLSQTLPSAPDDVEVWMQQVQGI